MKAIIFARVSSKEQEESGFSLPAQIKMLKKHAEDRGLEVIKSYSISETASKRQQRKTFDDMMKFVRKNNIKILVFEKVDRVTRNLQDSVKIYDWLEGDPERQLHCIKDSLVLHKNSKSQEKLNWDIRVVMAKNYADNLSEEVRKGYKEKIEQKIYPGRPKVGYRAEGRGSSRRIVFDGTKQPFMQEILSDFSTGQYSAVQLMNRANSKGALNEFGRPLTKTAMYRYLSDPFYYGVFEWNGEIYEGNHPQMISKETYDLNQRLLKRNYPPKYMVHNHAFKGLVRCAECGKMVTWYEKKGRVYGECNKKDAGRVVCNQRKCGREDLYEKEVIELLKSFQIHDKRLIGIIREELLKDNEEANRQEEITIRNCEQELTRVRTALNMAYEDKLNGVISYERYHEFEKKYQEREKELEKTIKNASGDSKDRKRIGVAIFDLSQYGGKYITMQK